MRILGIDPGLTRCGVGVIDIDSRRSPAFIFVDVIRTPVDSDLAQRLLELEQGIEMLLNTYKPDSVAVERVFSQHNVRSAMDTASASAVALLTCAKQRIEVTTYTPTEVKAAVTGSGRADKNQVTTMVTRLLKLDSPPKPADAADSLALALCHAWRGLGQNRVNQALIQQTGVTL